MFQKNFNNFKMIVSNGIMEWSIAIIIFVIHILQYGFS